MTAILGDPFGIYDKMDERTALVMKWAATGLQTRSIADLLELSPRTIKRDLEKGLEIVSRAEGRKIERRDLTKLVWDRLTAILDD